MKRVAFLYISTSSGHQRAAEAVMAALQQLAPNQVEAQGIDSLSHAYPRTGRLVARMYLELLKYAPQLWDYLYDNPAVVEATRELRELFNTFNTKKIVSLLKKQNPACLVCTQAVPASILADLKKRGKIKVPLMGIVTDFGVHSYWISDEMDLYMVATQEIKDKMVQAGITASKVLVTGIPIHPEIPQHRNKEEEKLRLGLHAHRPTVLVMGGSRGLGPLTDIVSLLRKSPKKIQVISVCGENQSILKAMHEKFSKDPFVRLFAYTDEISRLMDASDLLISKPGGLTCSETMAKGLPLLMIQPIPGQEERNARYMGAQNTAKRIDTLQQLSEEVELFFQDPKYREDWRRRCLQSAQPLAAFHAAEAILKTLKISVPHPPQPSTNGHAKKEPHQGPHPTTPLIPV